MNRLNKEIEKTFADVAMAEESVASSPGQDLHVANETFECTSVDVAFAETGDYTVTSCEPHAKVV